jgi:hypothetical protein
LDGDPERVLVDVEILMIEKGLARHLGQVDLKTLDSAS